MGNVTWNQAATWVDRSERGVRVLLSVGALGGLFAPKFFRWGEAFRDFTFSLWIADDARAIYRKERFKGKGIEQLRDVSQLVMNSLVALSFWAPGFARRFAWVDPMASVAWISTCAINVHLWDGAEQTSARADTFYALAVCCNMRLSMMGRNLHPPELFGAVSGAVGLWASFQDKN